MEPRVLRAIAGVFPGFFRGDRLHRAGLAAMAEGDYELARWFYSAAAERYRREVAVEALARLRVHELIGRVQSLEERGLETELCLEVERRLTLLERIESLEAPFEMRPTRTLLANWYGDEPDDSDAETAGSPATGVLHAA
jgi:hypothetical protein